MGRAVVVVGWVDNGLLSDVVLGDLDVVALSVVELGKLDVVTLFDVELGTSADVTKTVVVVKLVNVLSVATGDVLFKGIVDVT